MLSDPEKGRELLDTDLDDYMKQRDSNSSASTATATNNE
jgi:hypothetical protein